MREIAIDANQMIQWLYRDKYSPYGIVYEKMMRPVSDGLSKVYVQFPFYVIDDPENSGSMRNVNVITFHYNRDKDNEKMTSYS